MREEDLVGVSPRTHSETSQQSGLTAGADLLERRFDAH